MSLQRNILANFVSQTYVILIGIVMVPIYLRYMGAEAYGLVGFFAVLQSWFQLLDIGLTPTMARETARFNGGATDAQSLRRLLRAMEGVFVGVAVLGSLAMMVGSGAIARNWLKVQQLPLIEVQHAIMLMAMIVALRWVCGLYRSAINGFERLVWLSGFNMAIATARFVLVIPLFIYVGSSPTLFFEYQLLLAVVEFVVLMIQTYRFLPKTTGGRITPWRWAPLGQVLKFSSSVAFAGFFWVIATQSDKLLLSNLLPLAEYGYFTLVVLVAGGVLAIGGPVSGALLPRLTKLVAAGDERGMLQLYRAATQLVAVMAIPATLILALFPKQVLWAWTGDPQLVGTTAPILSLYAVGSGIAVISAFPYYLQFARGNIRLHLIGRLIFVMILAPSLMLAASRFGMTGAAWVWLGSNAAYLTLWVPIEHQRFAPGLHMSWLAKDIIAPSLPPVLVALLLQYVLNWPVARLAIAVQLSVVGLLLLILAGLSSRKIRAIVKDRFGGIGMA
jgi:O-antigen/teichoic acid export membrane protein